MTTPSDRTSAAAYTRDSVEAYLRAAGAERLRIELAIAEARARTERAHRKLQRLDALVGEVPTTGGDDPAALIDQLRTAMNDGSRWLQADPAAVARE
ncbi:MAG: hypothetical protein ACLQPH_06115 [Acidimicrobiales bacterium]